MIRKILFATVIGCAMISAASAAPLICPFTDYFNVIGANVRDLLTDGNLNGKITDNNNFTTSCKSNSSTGSGHAYVAITNGTEICYLTILDGPFENNPSIMSANCSAGLRYTGMDHSKGTYTYTLKFV